jgi:hypothetical protein
MEQVKTGIDDDDVDTFASELLLCISNSRQSRKVESNKVFALS